MRSLVAHTKMEIKLFTREIIALLFTFIVPAASFIVFGAMFQNKDYNGLSYFDAYIPGMTAIIVFTTGFFTIGVQLVIDREKGIYKRLQGTPLKPIYIFLAILIKGFIAVYAGAIEILVIAKLLFNANITPDYFQYFISLTFSAVTFFAMGFLVASLARRMQTALAIGFVSLYPMMFLSGATIPVEQLPDVMQKISDFIPLTAVVDLTQGGWTGKLFESDLMFDFIFLAVLCLGSILIGTKYFRWQ